MTKTGKTADEFVSEAELQLTTLLKWLEGGHLRLTPEEVAEVEAELARVTQTVDRLQTEVRRLIREKDL